jgi:gliding motility-associated-like protein
MNSNPIIFFLLLFCSNAIYAQTDTLFWFAAPDVSRDGTNDFDRPISFRITTYSQVATVTISQPANPSFTPQILTIASGSTQAVDLTNWIDIIENKPANTILNYGIKISATTPITVYYEVDEWLNPEIFVLKGTNALGSDFWIPSQNYLNNSPNFTPLPNSSFEIVATEDNTSITITPSNQIVGRPGGIPFVVILNKGQTYSAAAVSGLATNHLHGSRVISNKPIAITIKDDLLNGLPFYGTCSDLCGDQIIPTNFLGTEYIAINGFLDSPKDMVFVLATQNGTNIYQNGNLVSTLNAGQTIRLSVGDSSTYIKSDHPVYVLQLSGFGCEFGIDILPPIICTGSTEIAFTRSVAEPLFLNILVRNGAQNGFIVNGVSGVINGLTFKPVPGTLGQWLTGQITLPSSAYPVGSAIRIKNSLNALFHASIIHGGATTGSRFGYFSNFNTVKINAYINNSNLCAGSPIQLSADSIFQGIYSWSGPNGFLSSSRAPNILNSQIVNSGNYIVSATSLGCPSLPDTVPLTIHPAITKILTASICQGSLYTFPDGGTSSMSKTDTSLLKSSWGCDSIIITNLQVEQRIFSNINVTICDGESYGGRTVSGSYIDTLLSSNGCDSIRTLNLTVNPKSFSNLNILICEGETYLGHSLSGIYIDTLISSNGCDSIQTLNLTVKPKSTSDLNISICNGESYLGYTVSGIYIDTLLSSNGCDSIRKLSLNVKKTFFSNLSTSICAGDDYLGYTESGIYYDTLTAQNGCDSIVSINLTVLNTCEVYYPSAFTPNNDGKNDVFRILNAHNLLEYNLSIYNRWGQRVFETKDYTKGWNGNFNGALQPSGIYVWYSTFKLAGKDRKMKGTVALIR